MAESPKTKEPDDPNSTKHKVQDKNAAEWKVSFKAVGDFQWRAGQCYALDSSFGPSFGNRKYLVTHVIHSGGEDGYVVEIKESQGALKGS
jgi:hypothetical protein